MNAVSQVVETLLRTGAWKVVKYLSDKQIVRASRKRAGRKFGAGKIGVILTLGTPNYAERDFVKECKKAGQKFPLQKVQLQFPPKARVKAKGKK